MGGPEDGLLPGDRHQPRRRPRRARDWFQRTEGAKFWMQVLTDLMTNLDALVVRIRDGRR
jgi:hypothetical protein